MPQIADGHTDLVRNLLVNSQDPEGKQIKWKFNKPDVEDGTLPDITAKYKGEDGVEREYAIDMSKAMGTIAESVVEPKDAEEKKKKARKEMKQKNLENYESARGKTVGGPTQTPVDEIQKEREKQEKEEENDKEKHSSKSRR